MAKLRMKLVVALLTGAIGISSVTANAASYETLLLDSRDYLATGSCSSVGYDNSISALAFFIAHSVQITVQTYTKTNVNGEGLREVTALYYESDIVGQQVEKNWDESDGYLLTKVKFSYLYGDLGDTENAMKLAGAVTLEP